MNKLVFRESGKKEQQEIIAPPEVINEMIIRHAPLYLSPDCGRTWKPFGKLDWDYYYEVGIHVPEVKKVQTIKTTPAPAIAPSILPTISTRKDSETIDAVRWLSDNLPDHYSRKFNFPMKCVRSGLDLGKFFPSTGLAVATPYVSAWKETTFLHPIFSLSLSALLHRALSCWQLEKSGTRSFPTLHKQLLFLAMIHASGCIKQDESGLPNARIVEVHFMRVLEMLSWKHETASDRVHFPKLHVWRGADKEDATNIFKQVPVWLDFCAIAKDEYEQIVRERQKAAKVKARELALKSIRRSMYADISLKRLWNWMAAQIPQIVLENNPDFEQMFFAEESRIHAWTEEDFTALEDAFLKHCETGNSISYEVGRRLMQLKEQLKVYNDTFEIVIDTGRFAAYKGIPAPKETDFPSRAKYLVAKARWELGNKEQKVTPSKDSEEI